MIGIAYKIVVERSGTIHIHKPSPSDPTQLGPGPLVSGSAEIMRALAAALLEAAEWWSTADKAIFDVEYDGGR